MESSLPTNVAERDAHKSRIHGYNTEVLWFAHLTWRMFMSMNDEFVKSGDSGQAAALKTSPPWSECDLFCINGYSGVATFACGWRGRLREVRREEGGGKLRCPQCGGATLFRLPLKSPDSQ